MRLLALLAIIERAGVAFPYDCEGDGTDNDDDDDYVKNGVVGVVIVGNNSACCQLWSCLPGAFPFMSDIIDFVFDDNSDDDDDACMLC